MKVVIVGNGIAGTSLVDELLRYGAEKKDLKIVVFGEEKYLGYNRILITDVLMGRKLLDNIYIKRWKWYVEMGVELEVGKRVEKIFPGKKFIITDDGKTVKYDKLVIATGSSPALPNIKGIEHKNVFTYRSIEDVFRILEIARVSRKAVVVGGGLLGIEVASALSEIGIKTTLVHLFDVLMEKQIDKTASELLRKKLESKGIEVLLNKKTVEIQGEGGRARTIVFSDGDKIDADFFVIATGIKPRVELAQNSGIKVKRGILVDDYLETSASDVYAVGECVEHRGKTYGFVAPIMEQVKVCAWNLLYGNEKKYNGSITHAMLKVAGINLFSCGDFSEEPNGVEKHVVSFLNSKSSVYKKVVLSQPDGKVLGGIFFGDITHNEKLLELVRTGKKAEILEVARYVLPLSVVGEIGEEKDSDIICNCNSVTRGEIIKAILEKGARTLDDVKRLTGASTSCGSCADLVLEILKKRVEKPEKKKKEEEEKEKKKESPIELAKKNPHPFDEEFRKKLDMYFEKGDPFSIPEDDRDIRMKWYGIFYRKATPGFFMIRIRIPNGRLTYEQAKTIAFLSEKFARGRVEITSRQQIQIRWVELKNIRFILSALEKVGISTLQTGMDNVRNVVGDPLTGLALDSYINTLDISKDITSVFLGKKEFANLPRKFNIAVLGSRTDCINARYNDICLSLAEKDGKLGFNVYLGGKMGSGGPSQAKDINAFIHHYEAPELCRAVLDIYSTYGNRENRARSRFYFLIEEWGVERIREEIEKRMYKSLPEKGRDLVDSSGEREGIILQKNGLLSVSAIVPAGELSAQDLLRAAELSKKYGSREIRLSVYQNLYIVDIQEDMVQKVLEDELFQKYSTTSSPFAHVIACAGSRTCAFGVIPNKPDAVRVAKYVHEKVKPDFPLTMHWSACPRGCGQHGSANIGFVGAKGKRNGKETLMVDIFLGGSQTKEGKRVGRIPLEDAEKTVETIVKLYMQNRKNGEDFTDFVERMGIDFFKRIIQAEVV